MYPNEDDKHPVEITAAVQRDANRHGPPSSPRTMPKDDTLNSMDEIMRDVESILSASRFENVQYMPGEWYRPESLPGGDVSFLDGQALRRRARRHSRHRDDENQASSSEVNLMAASDGPESPVSRDNTSHASSCFETSDEASGDSTLPKIPSSRRSFDALMKRLVEGITGSAAVIRHAPNNKMGVVPRASLNSAEPWRRLDYSPPKQSKTTPEHVVARRGAVPSFTSMVSNGVVPDSVPPPRPYLRWSSSRFLRVESSPQNQLCAGTATPGRVYPKALIEKPLHPPTHLQASREAWSNPEVSCPLLITWKPMAAPRRAKSTESLRPYKFSQASNGRREAVRSYSQRDLVYDGEATSSRQQPFEFPSDCHQKVKVEAYLAQISHWDDPRL